MKKAMQGLPKIMLRFFRWYCRPSLVHHIEGDLLEVYRKRLRQKGKRTADIKLLIDVLLLIRPGIVRPANKHHVINHSGMYTSYFKIGWRTLLRNKGYSAINIGGLALGMSVSMLIGLWMFDELSFDKYHDNYDRIGLIRMLATDPHTGETMGGETMPLPIAAALKANYHQYFDHILVAGWTGDFSLSAADKKFSKKGLFIESGVPDMLSLKMVQGTHASLADPHAVIISKSTAALFFGREDPINKNLKINNRIDVTVAGVYEDIPTSGHFGEMCFFAPWTLWQLSNEWVRESETNWNNTSFHIYIQLKPGITMESAEAGIKGFYAKNGPEDLRETVRKFKPELLIYPMRQWHLYSDFKNGRPAGGRIMFVWLFGIVGAFVLLIACINFTNLTTARSERRAKEVGVRKAIGSRRSALVQQFISESLIVVLIAFIVSLVVSALALPLFNDLAAKKLELPFNQPFFWAFGFAFLLLTGLMASIYPAFYLSSFQPVSVLKGTIRVGRFSTLPRKVMVVIQFTVSVTLIIGTAVVYQQIQFARSRPVGYNREGLISIPKNDPGYNGKLEVLRNELKNSRAVSEVAYASSPLTAVWNGIGGFEWKGKDPEEASDFSVTSVSCEFGQMVGWEFINGRDFSRSFISDSMGVVINETAANYLKLKNPIGETIRESATNGKTWQIVGVIKDMVMTSPYEPETRAFFFLQRNPDDAAQIHIKINPAVSAAIAIPKIQEVFKRLVPSASFDYKFVDEQFALKFGQEERIGKLASLFAVLAVFISCLGLFGLASFVAERRTKEIGIRKVLGASVFKLWGMLSKDFVYLVIVSILISIPLASYFMNNWLMNYKYRTEINWWIFAASGTIALLITMLTVSYQSIKVALGNPANSLRSE